MESHDLNNDLYELLLELGIEEFYESLICVNIMNLDDLIEYDSDKLNLLWETFVKKIKKKDKDGGYDIKKMELDRVIHRLNAIQNNKVRLSFTNTLAKTNSNLSLISYENDHKITTDILSVYNDDDNSENTIMDNNRKDSGSIGVDSIMNSNGDRVSFEDNFEINFKSDTITSSESETNNDVISLNAINEMIDSVQNVMNNVRNETHKVNQLHGKYQNDIINIVRKLEQKLLFDLNEYYEEYNVRMDNIMANCVNLINKLNVIKSTNKYEDGLLLRQSICWNNIQNDLMKAYHVNKSKIYHDVFNPHNKHFNELNNNIDPIYQFYNKNINDVQAHVTTIQSNLNQNDRSIDTQSKLYPNKDTDNNDDNLDVIVMPQGMEIYRKSINNLNANKSVAIISSESIGLMDTGLIVRLCFKNNINNQSNPDRLQSIFGENNVGLCPYKYIPKSLKAKLQGNSLYFICNNNIE